MKTYTLKKSIEFGDEIVTTLEFREPIMGDLYGMNLSNMSTEDFMDLAARLSGKLPALMKNLSITDGVQIMQLVSDFLVEGQETGSES